jgi:hypothetical protein
MKIAKLASIIGLLLLVGEARASILTTVGDWAGSPQVLGPNTFTLLSLPGNLASVPVQFFTTDVPGVYLVELADDGPPPVNLSTGTYSLTYTVTTTSDSPLFKAALGVDNPGGGATATKVLTYYVGDEETSQTLYYPEVLPDSPGSALLPFITSLTVVETIVVGTNSIVTGSTDTYFEQPTGTPPIPEPMSLVVWSILGTGLGLAVWRRRKVA